jgi:hypothetical protein
VYLLNSHTPTHFPVLPFPTSFIIILSYHYYQIMCVRMYSPISYDNKMPMTNHARYYITLTTPAFMFVDVVACTLLYEERRCFASHHILIARTTHMRPSPSMRSFIQSFIHSYVVRYVTRRSSGRTFTWCYVLVSTSLV